MEMYQAFLLPLNTTPSPSAPSEWQEPLEINYDAILPSTRRHIARSRSACADGMKRVRTDLARWGEGCTGQEATGIGSAAAAADTRQHAPACQRAHREDTGRLAAEDGGTAGSGRRKRTGLAAQMKRPVRLIAVTPTQQISTSSVGREVSIIPLILPLQQGASTGKGMAHHSLPAVVVLLLACHTPLLDASHDCSARAGKCLQFRR